MADGHGWTLRGLLGTAATAAALALAGCGAAPVEPATAVVLPPATPAGMAGLMEAAPPAAPAEAARTNAEAGADNLALLLSTASREGKEEYVVRSGDTLERIARRQGVTVELLAAANGLKGDRLAKGQTLLVPSGRFSIHVDKSDNVLTVFRDGRFFKSYRVATGRNNRTPVGTFRIADRQAQPKWWRPTDHKMIPYGDPENELGTHWIAWDLKGYGIHGTWQPETIGTQASAGCVRMRNEDVAELFTLVPNGTQVTVED